MDLAPNLMTRNTPRTSSMNVRDALSSAKKGTRNHLGGDTNMFLTQVDYGQAPRTGGLAFRNNKIAPLLTPVHNRPMSMQMVHPVSAMDIDREKTKIARFLSTKERFGIRFKEREAKAVDHLKLIEKRNKEFEKMTREKRKLDKEQFQKQNEKGQSFRTKVHVYNQELDQKSM